MIRGLKDDFDRKCAMSGMRAVLKSVPLTIRTRSLDFCLLILLLGACATYGPSPDDAQFESAVAEVIPVEEIVIARKGEWYPNQFGFNQIQVTVFEPSSPVVTGVFVMTDDEVVFLVYHDDASKFVRAFSVGRDEIDQALTDSFGNSNRLVLMSNDRVNSFAVLKPNSSTFLDKELPEEIARELSIR